MNQKAAEEAALEAPGTASAAHRSGVGRQQWSKWSPKELAAYLGGVGQALSQTPLSDACPVPW